MTTIQEIFENSLFRIPDYQRGYSWKDSHLDDFWQDLQNLRDERFHYTGDLTLEKATAEDLKKWKGDEWIINSGSYKPYFVVDGQQRLTTIIVILNILIELLEDEEQYLYQDKLDLIGKYLFKKNEKSKLQSFIFGYEIDDPSYEYLKTQILKQESSDAANQPETIYTNNLMAADKFFRDRISGWSLTAREKFFKKVTQNLKFDLKVIGTELDIFVVFETMNNRGKPLSQLEKLKNRLIYLTTLLQETESEERIQLRKEINNVWKTCYEYLGKNKKNPLNDDAFLRNHFILYHYYEKTKDYPYLQIFKQIYTVQQAVMDNPKVSFESIRKYINSIQKAVILWYIINNPKQALSSELVTVEEAYWLEKLNRLGFGAFASLTLSVYLVTKNVTERVNYLKAVESFIFLNYHCAGRKSNLGNSHFPYLASHLYAKSADWSLEAIISNIYFWTFGNEDEEGYFSPERFVLITKDQFTHSKKSGFYDWSGIKYLLFEYEEYIQKSEPSKVRWKTPNSIEHIYPQNDADVAWKSVFKEYTPKQRKILCNSLGNLVLLRSSKNSQLSNKPFDFKRCHINVEGESEGYCVGSHSEIQVSMFKMWDAKAILKRGLSILNFVELRWNVKLTNKEKKYLLLSDEVLIEKI